MPNRCILCKNQMELVNHMFIHYPYSREVWDNLTKNFGVSWCKLGNVLDFFCHWISMFKGLDLLDLSTWTLPHFCWGVQKERNNRIFRESEEPAYVLGENIYRNIKENYQVRKGGDIENGGNKKEKDKYRRRKRQEPKWLLPLKE